MHAAARNGHRAFVQFIIERVDDRMHHRFRHRNLGRRRRAASVEGAALSGLRTASALARELGLGGSP